MDLKEYVLPSNTLIGGWYIPSLVCDDLITLFKENKEYQGPGVVAFDRRIDKSVKVSTDLGLHYNYKHQAFMKYKKLLGAVIGLYEKKYREIEEFSKFGMVESCQIQHYKPGEGFKTWHFERSSKAENRCLVFMTYLNDVPDAGTHFKYQDLTTPAEKGLTLMWPTDFSHTHKGQITKHHEKYIITGWLGYV
jgi:hypothetical protein